MNEFEKLAHAVLLFLRGGPWTNEDHLRWKELTGSPLATTVELANLARRTLEKQHDSRISDDSKHPDNSPLKQLAILGKHGRQDDKDSI